MLTERRIRTGIPTGLDPGTRRHWRNLGTLALAILTTLALLAAPAAGAPAGHSASPVLTIPPPVPPTVVGTSTLVRTDHGVSATVETSALAPGDVVTLWWIVFNNPEACENPFAGSPCGPPDVLNPETQASLLPAAGRIVDEDGTAGYGAHLRVGDTSRALLGPGLLDAREALVILVLKTHGPKIPELTSEMLSTFAAGCQNQDDVPPGTPPDLVGTPGPNECAEIQFTVHSP
jgi:hypothetical protein